MKKIFLIFLLINNVKLFSFADCNVPAGSYTGRGHNEKKITWLAYGLANGPSTITCNDAKICKANGYGANITCPNAKTCSGNGPSTINCQNATTCSVNGGTMNCPNAK